MARRKSRYSGIGGQAVLEGVMMKNKEKYAVAVRKPDGEIEVDVETYQGLAHGGKFKELPFIRGIFNFLDSLIFIKRNVASLKKNLCCFFCTPQGTGISQINLVLSHPIRSFPGKMTPIFI